MKFDQWGVENREVSVNVYRFPGVATEIVVPSDYARKLDAVREERLNPPPLNFEMERHYAANDNNRPYEKRILPEEIAQMLQQLPQPDIVRSVELLDHRRPWDLHEEHARTAKGEKDGEAETAREFVALADASSEKGINRIRFMIDLPMIRAVPRVRCSG